ncbi:MAG TPA: bifunctional UDP-N-acetylmuramoyl-tripeptide:D-alanyl-D-alanine ligase/alanine racemase [Bacteroidia bacterium]|nr:bifunctional UDP-N-acetylmuramoyl-tripeptide:D-alanyl-D-alanine ligase/alanine racemase [Bacteroidia bacterium]
MTYTLNDIASSCAAVKTKITGNPVIQHLLIDSRRVTSTANVLFIAIPGERHDGHAYIKDLYAKGIRAFMVSQDDESVVDSCPDASFIIVSDTLAALQRLAAVHRKKFQLPVVAITGSNGKTIVKEWIWQLLRDDFSIVRSPKSYNSQVGVPLSVWQINESHTLGLFEAGISRPGEMEKLNRIIQPDIVLFTNLGPAHDENFSDRAQKAREKLKLTFGAKAIIYCKDDAALHQAVKELELQAFTWSRKIKADLQISKVNKTKSETVIQGIYNNSFHEITIPFVDDASVENAIHCWALLLQTSLSLKTQRDLVLRRFAQLAPVAMRLELKGGLNNCSVINDSYNSDVGSLTVALDFLNQQQQHPKRTLILSDILQSGREEKELYTEVASYLKTKGVQRLIGIGPALSRQKELFTDVNATFFASTGEFISAFESSWFHNETILLKGARAFEFESISKLLQQKSHETVLEIDLSAMVHNLNYVRSRLNPGTKLMVMVKAFSYGSGSFEIANILQFHRVGYLAVAYADEGSDLRRSGITLPIMVMNPEEQSYDTMIANKLEPEIYSFRVLQLFEEAARKYRKVHPETEPIPVHIKFDTGMKRLGFDEEDMNELVVRLKNSRDLVIRSVFSHLAASDEAQHDDFTRKQVKQFTRIGEEMKKHFAYPFLRHILNSSGILRFPDAQFEMVRLGIGLYGIAVEAEDRKHFRNVSTLRTTISQLRQVNAGETIGYSRKGVATENMIIATVPIGYADGLHRVLSNGKGKMWINGKAAHIVGNVCMDMCMLDVTGINCKEGDDVIVFDDEHSIEDLAKDMGTISYEVLTNVSPRVKRVYWQE